jgi:hypothetical protein
MRSSSAHHASARKTIESEIRKCEEELGVLSSEFSGSDHSKDSNELKRFMSIYEFDVKSYREPILNSPESKLSFIEHMMGLKTTILSYKQTMAADYARNQAEADRIINLIQAFIDSNPPPPPR